MKYHKILKNKYKNWRELENQIRNLETELERGNIMEEFAYLYFNIKKNYYNIDQIYMRKDVPGKLIKKYFLEDTDHGIDGLIIRNDGTSLGYQVKFRSNRLNTPTYKELSTFWTEGEYMDYRLIFSNTTDLPSQTKKRKNQLTLLADELDKLDHDFFEKLFSLTNNTMYVPEQYQPLPHQRKIINDVLSGFSHADRGKVIAACGTGKTLIAKWIVEEMHSNTILFMAPSLSLIKQTINEWYNKSEKKFNFIAVCSDSTVTNDIESENITENIDFPVTTNKEQILKFLNEDLNIPKVIFSTYHSVDAISSALLNSDIQFDLGIFDESHRTVGASDSNMFNLALNDNNVPIKKRLFMTATEKFITSRVTNFANENGIEVFSMDDTEMYGELFSQLNFGQAIEQGIIADYKIVVSAITESEVADFIKYNSRLSVDVEEEKITDAEDILYKSILAKAFKELDICKVVTYHSTVNRAKFFTSEYDKTISLRDIFSQIAPNILDSQLFIDYVSGYFSASKRSKTLNDFASSKYGVISNAKCLTEGVDVPSIDAVYFVDNKNSTIDIIQAIGRALRKKKNEQKTAYIIIPIILCDNDLKDLNKNNEAFSTLHQVVQALRDNDSKLAEIIDDINYNNGHISKPKNPKKPSTLKLEITVSNKINMDDFAEGIELRISNFNKENSNTKKIITYKKNKNDRKSSIKRTFKTIGDYNMKTYFESCIDPTLSKFENKDQELKYSEIKVNNNNVSHTERIGFIKKDVNKNYFLTDLGKKIYEDNSDKEEIFKQQLLRYYLISNNEGVIFPYRFLIKLLKEVKYINQFEFMWAVFYLTSTSEKELLKAIKRIKMLRETYDINNLSEANKLKVLELLNTKFHLKYDFKDVFSTRSTAYNQYNYFAKHLTLFSDLFYIENKTLYMNNNKEKNIENLLYETKEIEDISQSDEKNLLENLYRS